MRSFFGLLSCFVLLFAVTPVAPVYSAPDRVWAGGNFTDGRWSNPNNWNPVGVPQDGEDLEFSDAGFFGTVNMHNDLVGLRSGYLFVDGNNWTLDGNELTLGNTAWIPSGGTIPFWRGGYVDLSGNGTFTINCPLRLETNTLIGAFYGTLRVNVAIDLNGQDLTVYCADRQFMSGPIIGTGNVTAHTWSLARSCSLTFDGTSGNTFSGTMRVTQDGNDGDVIFNKQFGSVVNDALIVEDQGVCKLARPHQIADHAVVCIGDSGQFLLQGRAETVGALYFTNHWWGAAALVDTAGSALTVLGGVNSINDSSSVTPTFRGLLDISLGNHTFDIAGSSFYGLNVEGAIIGDGGITKTGNSALLLWSSNNFFGTVIVGGGIIEARHSRAFGNSGGLTLAGGSITLNNVFISNKTLWSRGQRQITANTFGSLLSCIGLGGWAGRIELDTNLVVNSTDLCLMGGPVVGPGGFEFLGSRNQLIDATFPTDNPYTYTGLTRVLCQELIVSANNPFNGPIEVGGSFSPSHEMRWQNYVNNGLPQITLHDNAWADLNGRSDTWSQIIFNGGRITTGTGLLATHHITSNPANVTATIQGNLKVASTPLTPFDIADGAAMPDLAIDAVISDEFNPAGINKNGNGELYLNAANTYRGQTFVYGGIVHAQNNASLGDYAVGTIVRDGATLQVEFAGALSEPLNIAGNGRGATLGALHLIGGAGLGANLVLDASSMVRVDTGFGIIGGVISGVGNLTKVGVGALQIGGGSGPANTFSGDTIVLAGEVVLNKPTGVISVPGHLIIGGAGGGLFPTAARVRHFGGFTIVGSVTVNRGGLWNLNGYEEGFNVAALQGRPSLTLNGGGSVQTGTGRVYLPPGGDVVVGPAGPFDGISSISGSIGLDSGAHRFVVSSAATFGGPDFDVPADIRFVSGTAGFTKLGFGAMRLAGNNDFNGELIIDEGKIIAGSSLAFGLATAGTVVNSNASLALENGVAPGAEMLTLDSDARPTLEVPSGAASWGGLIWLYRTADVRVGDPAASLALNTSLLSAGGLIKSGEGRLDLGGASANSYVGLTVVQSGLVQLLKPANTMTLPGDVTIGDGVGASSSAVVRATAAGQLSANPIGTIASDGFLDLNLPQYSQTSVRAFPGSGRLNLSTNTVLSINNDVPFEFSGVLTSGNAGLSKNGSGQMHLSGDSPGLRGGLDVNEGTVKIDGNLANVSARAWGTSILRGDGILGDTVLATDSVLIVDSKTPGRSGGDLELASLGGLGGIVGVEFFGPSATGGNEQIISHGEVLLNNKRLSASFFYPPREGDVLTVIRKDSAGAINGTFSGWPEGTMAQIGNVPVRASYVGGNGNDFTLTVTNLLLGSGGMQIVNGGGGSAFVPNDCLLLWLPVTNRSAGTITGAHGNLHSLTPGVVVTIPEADYPDLAPNARGTNLSAFQIRTEPSFACGSLIELELILAASNTLTFAIPYTVPGAAGTALSLDGVNDNVSIAHTNALDAYPLTVTAWFKTTQATEQAGLVAKYRFTPFIARGGWQLALANGNVYGLYDYGGDGLITVDGGFVADGQWHHAAFTVDDSGANIYVDGVFKQFSFWENGPIAASSGTSMRIGTDGGGGFFAGTIEEVSVWNMPLDQSQIQANMRRSLAGNEPGLLAYYHFNEAGGNTTADSAPAAGNNNGTLSGGASFVPSTLSPFNAPGGPDCNSGRGACESCIVVNGQFSTNTATTLRPLNFVGSPSICFPPKPCPEAAFYPDTTPVAYLIHAFTNGTSDELCLTAQLRFGCSGAPSSALGGAAYLGSNLISSPCVNYLGDTGADGTQPFSFRVPPQTNFVLLVSARATNIVCDRYTLELFGLPCPPPTLYITKQATNALLSWSSAYPDYRLESASSLEGSAPYPFVAVTNSPVLLNGQYAVSNSLAAPRQFFRLAR